jgi:hypothetical protein
MVKQMTIKGIARYKKPPEPLEDIKCEQFFSFYSHLKSYGQLPGLEVIHIANQQGRNKMVYTQKLMRMGLKPGCPDYLVTYKGKYAWIEFKRHIRDCRLKAAQLAFQQECLRDGVPHFVTSEVDSAIDFLKSLLKSS